MNGKTPPFQISSDASTMLIKIQETNQWGKISALKNGVKHGSKLPELTYLSQFLSTTMTSA
jgi:hypothetical protein